MVGALYINDVINYYNNNLNKIYKIILYLEYRIVISRRC